jgi:hypothetical protein
MSLQKPTEGKRGVIVVLGTTQTLAWASSYYLPAILADRISEELRIPSTWFFAAFSCSLVVAAMVVRASVARSTRLADAKCSLHPT